MLHAAIAAALALAASVDASPASVPPPLPSAAVDVGAVLAALRGAPAGGPRAAAATRPLVAAPYLASPLGEGEGPDADPRFRLDAFDCLTLVETAVALGSASTLEEARAVLDDVRYRGAAALATRNHEMLSQWIPANVAKGWIADAAPRIAGPLARIAEKEYSAASWAAVRAAGRAVPGVPRARLPVGRYGVHVVAAADVPAVSGRVPEGTIVLAVRADAPDRATRVTHAGLVVAGPGGRRLVRHATSSKGIGRVIEEPIDRFARREARAYPRWPLEGLAFLAIRANEARARALAAAAVPAGGGGRHAERPRAGPLRSR